MEGGEAYAGAFLLLEQSFNQYMSEKISILIQRFNDHIVNHKALDANVAKILENHLPHLQAAMVELKTNLKWHFKIGGLIGGAVAGIFTGGLTILFNILLK